MKKNLLIATISTILVGGSLVSCSSPTTNPSACDCANLLTGPYSPSNIEYTAEELNEGTKLEDDVNTFVEIGRACTLKYGNLTDIERELVEGALSIPEMPGFDTAKENASKQCN